MKLNFRLFFAALLFAGLSTCEQARAATPLVDAQMTGSNNQVKSGATLTVKSGGSLVIEGGGTISGTQPLDAKLTAFSALSPSSGYIPYFTGSSSMDMIHASAYELSLMPLTTRTAMFNAIAPASPATGDLMYFDGTNWVNLILGLNLSITTGTLNAASGAPATGSFLTTTSESLLPNSTNLGALTSGLLKISVSGGIASVGIATSGTDYLPSTAIGASVEAWSANLDTWSAKTAPGGTVVGNTDTQTLTNKTLTSPSISDPTITGAFSPPIVSTDPVSPGNGRLWYNSTGGAMKAQIGGSTVSLGGGGGGGTGANPTASVGLTAVNGSATTFLRSDSAPAISSSVLNQNATTTSTVQFARMGIGATVTGTHLLDVQGTGSNLVVAGFGDLASTGPTFLQIVKSTTCEMTSRNGQEMDFAMFVGGTTDTTSLSINSDATVSVASATDATSGTAGALKVVGGLAVAKKIISSSAILSTSGSAGVGYATGAGGAITQGTSRTTGVTINDCSGAITLVSAAGSASFQSFTVTDSAVAATDTVLVVEKSGSDKYQIFVTAVAAGSFQITYATTGGTTTEQPIFNFAIVKAVSS